MPVEPGLNAIAYVGRAIDFRVFIMGNAVFLAPDVAHQVGPTFQCLDLSDHRPARLFIT